MDNLAKNIRDFRKAHGWTQLELAEKLGTNQQAITSYENEHSKPPIDRLPFIAALFGVTVDELIGVKKVTIKRNGTRTHKNSRNAKVQELFEKLSPEEQRTTLKQIKALVESKNK